jgi:hypothetical protein
MSLKLVGDYPGIYIFPLAHDHPVPEVGFGFDLVGGGPIALQALTQTPSMNPKDLDGGDSQYFSIYDNTTFQTAIEFDASTSGGGLGVQSGMCVSASARMDTSNTSFTIQFNGAKTTKQTIVSASAGLTDDALQCLKNQGPGKFVEKYGTYFVAGYIYGKSCKASYSLQFSSMDMAVTFAASFNESGTELGFSSKISASIQSSLSASHTQATVSASQNSLGFNAPTVSDIASLQALITAYDNISPTDDSPISILVMPWQYLSAVDKVLSGINCVGDFKLVTDLMNNYLYIKNTANNFINNRLYTGNTQLTNVRTIESKASDEFQRLSKLIDSAAATRSKITIENGANLVVNGVSFPHAEAMIDTLNFSITRFALSWKAWVGPGYPLSTTMTTLDGSPVPVSSDHLTVDGSAGTYFTWSIDGNSDWAGTNGTQSMSYAIASLPSGWNMAIVLDRALGTLHCVCRGVGQPLADNPVSKPPITIRGNSNAKPCTDLTNPTRISCDLQGGNYLICPM